MLEPLILNNIPSYLPSVVCTHLDLGKIPPKITSICIRDQSPDGSSALSSIAIAAATAAFTSGLGASRVDASAAAAAAFAFPPNRFADQVPASSGLSRSGGGLHGDGDERGDAVQPMVDSVIIEMGIEYEGNPKVEMALASSPATTFGIDSARVSGIVEVIVAPLISRAPIAAAFQACFLNPPTIDFTLTGIAAAGDMGPWTAFFRKQIDQIFSSLAVIPNRLVYKILPGSDFLEMCRPSHPVGILRIAVLRGYGFPHTDTNTIKQTLGQSAEPDVYVILRLGNVTHQTETVNDKADPVFNNQVFDFILSSNSPRQKMQIDAYDYDLGQDDELGTGSVSPSALIRQKEVEVRLHNSPLGAIPRLRLAARFIHLSSALADVQTAVVSLRTDKTRPQSCSSLMLAVAIDCATNLPTGGKTRPFVRTLLNSKQIIETWPALELATVGGSSTANPRWEFSRHVLIDTPVNSETRVTFEVRDNASSNDLMGTAFLHLADLLRYPGCAKVYKFALCGAWRADSTLRVRVGLEAAVTDGVPLWQCCSADQQLKEAQSEPRGNASSLDTWTP